MGDASNGPSPAERGLTQKDLGVNKDPRSPQPNKTPFQQFLESEAKRDKTPIFGGEIIRPGAVRADDPRNPDGSINLTASKNRGWLSAINSANGKQDIPESEKQKNVQEIVTGALAAGVSREQLGAHLQALGIKTVLRESAVQPQAGETLKKGAETQVQADETSIARSMDYISKLADSVLGGRSEAGALQSYVDYAMRNGIPRDRVEALLQAKGINIQRKEGSQETGLKEQLINSDNSFNEENAAKIIGVTRDWIKFGGTLYDHLTGKDPRLERGVDYKMLPDGKIPDIESYKAARQQRIETWRSDPGNQKWIADARQFNQGHQSEMSNRMEKVQVRQPDGTLTDKDSWTTPYVIQHDWINYDSNYFNKQTGEMTQPNREETAFRVYFSPEGANVMGTFQDVITELNADPEMQKYGFQIKTADVSNFKDKDIAGIINQKDRVVLYLGENGLANALPLLQKYAARHPGMFNQEGVLLGQPLVDASGNKIPGIVVTSETKGISPDPKTVVREFRTFNELQARIVEPSYNTIISLIREPQALAQLKVNHPQIYQGISSLGEEAKMADYLKVIMADPNGEDFLKRNLQLTYPQWAKSYGMSTKNIAFKAA